MIRTLISVTICSYFYMGDYIHRYIYQSTYSHWYQGKYVNGQFHKMTKSFQKCAEKVFSKILCTSVSEKINNWTILKKMKISSKNNF